MASIEYRAKDFIEKHFPREVTNYKGEKGRLSITQVDNVEDKNYYGWYCIKYGNIDTDFAIETIYVDKSCVYLISFCETLEEAVIDMTDRLLSCNLI